MCQVRVELQTREFMIDSILELIVYRKETQALEFADGPYTYCVKLY